MPQIPSSAIVANQSAMIGPNALPIRAVPWGWMANSATRIRTETGKHIGCEGRKRDVQPLQRREHRNRRRDRPVAVDQRRAEKTDRDDDGAMLSLHAKQRHQREDAALAVIVDAHRDGHVFDRRHHDQGPDHERQHAERDRRVGSAAGEAQDRLERVERARPDVAEDHPQRREAERRQASEVRRAGYSVTGRKT